LSIILSVNNVPFEIPTAGQPAPWGESLTDYFSEVAKVLNSLKGANDILETGATILNNQATFLDIPDFKFNPALVRSFSVQGSIAREVGPTKVYESFVLNGLRTDTGWILQQEGFGDSGVILDITPAGQVQYKSSNISGGGSGLLKFRGIGITNSAI
jgi:hypothetical protein